MRGGEDREQHEAADDRHRRVLVDAQEVCQETEQGGDAQLRREDEAAWAEASDQGGQQYLAADDQSKDRPGLRVDVEVSQWAVLLQHLESESIEFFVAYPGPTTNDPRYEVNMLASRPASLYCRAEHPLVKASALEPRPDQVPDFPWALVQIDNLIETQLRQLFAVGGDRELPIRLRCDNQALLLESVMSSDAILFTWEAWLEKELAQGSIVDLGARLQPAIPAQARQLSVGIVQLADRTLSPAARKLISLIMGREEAGI